MSTVNFPDDPHQDDSALQAGRQGRLRDQAARQRDTAAARRDDLAGCRDEAALERDQSANHRSESVRPPAVAVPDVMRLLQAADIDRSHSYVDRIAASNDRADAATDRYEALSDRMDAARDRRKACLDGLTGAYNREAGLLELARDVARASRSGHLLVVAFLDVDHLKITNDTQGHAAGDHVLMTVAATLHAALRPYDLVIRYGGDEFVCAAEGIDVHAARLRFDRINELLARAVPGLTVTVGLAELGPGESTEAVIARADADLYGQREQRRG